MGLIISVDGEHSTDEVIDWITYLGGTFKRVNITNDIEEKTIEFALNQKEDGNSLFGLKHKNGWLRKSGFYDQLNTYSNLREEGFEVNRYLNNELSALRTCYFLNAKINWLNNPKSYGVGKIKVLEEAKRVGLDFPETFVTNNREKLIKFYTVKKNGVISKSLTDVPYFSKKKAFFMPFTVKISLKDFDQMPKYFFPSLFQEYIPKSYEIRCFIIKRRFYSAAIFSQGDNKTKVDFRNYNKESPNRLVPYLLPKEIKDRILNLMKNLNLNTGSVDLIRGVDKKYYFLEINTSGQFGMVSKPCNYFIEKEIAKNLVKHEI